MIDEAVKCFIRECVLFVEENTYEQRGRALIMIMEHVERNYEISTPKMNKIPE